MTDSAAHDPSAPVDRLSADPSTESAVPLDADRLSVTGWPTVDVVDTIDSTNAELLRRESAGSSRVDSVLIAESQTAGRGRLDRRWESAAGTQILASVALHPTVDASRLPLLPLLTGLVIAEVLESFGLDATVKWPNDVLVDGRKIAGVLTQLARLNPGDTSVIVGFGINVSAVPAGLDPSQATCMTQCGFSGDRTTVAARILARLSERYNQWLACGGGGVFIDQVRSRCDSIGRELQVSLPDGSILRGVGQDIAADGSLLVRDEASVVHTVDAGDVIHVRARS